MTVSETTPSIIEVDKKASTGNGQPSSFDIIAVIRLLWRRKIFIILTTLAITVAAFGVSWLIPESFKSTSVILPETDKTKLGSLGGLSDLASLAGVGSGDVSPVKLYPAILKSEAILKPIIYNKYKTKKFSDSVNLIQYWEINANTPERAYELALIALRNGLDVNMDVKTGILTLTYDTEEPQLTADIINSSTAELDKFMRIKRTTNATKQRQWIEARLAEVKQDLAASEIRLKDFREKNRVITGSPLLMLEQDRLLREVQINGTLYAELKKQYELIKIEEIKNTPIVYVMDPAVPAAKKDKPRRGIITLTSFLLALVGSGAFVYIKHNHSDRITAFLKEIKG